jgi:hypothetical protein
MTDAAISENHPHYQLRPGTILYRRGVKHDADGGAERLGGERVAELGADDARVAWTRKNVSIAGVERVSKSAGLATASKGESMYRGDG